MNYIQLLFSYFNAPLFATFIIAMFWKRTSPKSGVYGLAAGTLGRRSHALRVVPHRLLLSRRRGAVARQDQRADGELLRRHRGVRRRRHRHRWRSRCSRAPKTDEELAGLVYGIPDPDAPDPAIARRNRKWWESPALLGWSALGITAALSLIFL